MISYRKITTTLFVATITMCLSGSAFAAVGGTEGSATVSATGEATYTVPLKLPLGTNGLTPELALSYNHKEEESLIGVGWGISGLSAITRCVKTKAQDGAAGGVTLTTSDRYCLDGNQLRLVNGVYGLNGSTYRTEVDMVARVTAIGTAGNNGPASFKVESKDGLIYEYGNTTDSRIESLALGKTTTARVWALSKITDRAGNEIKFAYIESGAPYGSYRPNTITYRTSPLHQGLPVYRILFTYENQPTLDVDTSYATGGVVEDTKRLKSIDISRSLSTQFVSIRKYELAYEGSLSSTNRSRLSSIKECAPTTTDCLAPITFTYQSGTNGLNGETSSGSVIATNTKPLSIDINGDGRTDLVYPSAFSGGQWMYRLANTSGGYENAVNSVISSINHEYAIVIDHNSDGLDDILVPYSGTTWWAIHGSSFGLLSPVNTFVTHNGISSPPGNAASVDISGDGRDDLVWADEGVLSGNVWVQYRNSSGDGFGAPINLWTNDLFSRLATPSIFDRIRQNRNRNFTDFNGDGYRDIAFVIWSSSAYMIRIQYGSGSGSGSYAMTLSTTIPPTAQPLDLNGDGYTDVAYQIGSSLYTSVSTGNKFGSQFAGGSVANLDWTKAVVIDWSGDGFDDLLVPNTANGLLYLAQSDGFKLLSPVSTGISHSNAISVFATDSNGDNLPDIAYVKSNNNTFVHRAHSGVMPDLLTNVVDGNGNTAVFEYATLSDSNVYTKGGGALFPTVDYLQPLYVVETLTQSTGTGTTFDLDYQYEGAKANIEGRGIGGFEKRTVTDGRTGNKTIEGYHTDFPYRGRLKSREQRLSDNTLVQELSQTWATRTGGTGFQNYHYPYVSTSTEENFEGGGTYNGDQINTITTTAEPPDVYGTLYDVTTTTTEHTSGNGAMPGVAFVERTYTEPASLHNVTSTWCIGRRQQVQQINWHTGTYDGDTITRTIDYIWDTTNNCRITKKTTEPGSTNYTVSTDFEYDTFGNNNKQTVTGVDAGTTLPTRVTQINWGTLGQFPTTVTNPLSQVTNLTWNSSTGDLLSVTDPNGLVNSWQYDAFNRRTRETRTDGTYTDYSRTDCTAGNGYCGTGYSTVKTQIHASGKNTSGVEIRYADVFLDSMNRTVETASQIIGGGTSRIRIVFDASGREWKRSAPTLTTGSLFNTEITYDALGRPVQVSRPINDGTSVLQNSLIHYEGLKTRRIDAENHETWTIQDALGRVYQSHDNLAHYQQFEMDAFGSVKKVKDCVSYVCTDLTTLTYAYGSEAFRIKSVDMSLGDWDYSFNSLGEVTAYNDAKTGGALPVTATARFTWDKLGRPLTRVEAEGTTTWTWGTSSAAKNIGRLASVSSPGHSQSFTYDSKGRMAQHRRVGGGTFDIDYVYNAGTGLLDSVQYPASTGGYRFKVLQEYDHGILKRVKRSDSPQTIYWEAQTQDAFGNIIDEDFGNGSTTIRGYDGVTGWLDHILTDKGATSLQNLTYTWDKVGNLLSRKDWRQTNTPTEIFDYDSLNRLTEVDVSGAAMSSLSVTFDVNGNIKKKDDVSTSDWVYHNTNKHAVVTAGANSYGYDANGNMTSRKGNPITWASYNYPTTIVDGTRTYNYSYDASRQKWQQVYTEGSISETTYFAGRIFEKNVHSGDTEHRHHIMAGGRAVALFVERTVSTDYVRYLTADHLGSVDGVIQDDGTTTYVNESFSPFGKRRDPTDWVGDPSAGDLTKIAATTDRGYTDHISLEKSSLVHMNGRVYDAEIGRFLSPDPFIANPLSTQGFNRYAYVENNPMRYTDPTGFFCTGPEGIICIGVLKTFRNFFGFGSDDPPPPDFCKDNTKGCGGVAASNSSDKMTLDVSQTEQIDYGRAVFGLLEDERQRQERARQRARAERTGNFICDSGCSVILVSLGGSANVVFGPGGEYSTFILIDQTAGQIYGFRSIGGGLSVGLPIVSVYGVVEVGHQSATRLTDVAGWGLNVGGVAAAGPHGAAAQAFGNRSGSFAVTAGGATGIAATAGFQITHTKFLGSEDISKLGETLVDFLGL